MTRARVTLAIAFGALALTACGGGGGDDDGNGGNGGNCTTDPTGPGCATANKAPTAKANGPYSSVAGGTITFTAAGSSDPEDGPDALKYSWAFGDGASATGAQATHAYATANSYTATLTVTDTKGATATSTAPVTITAAPSGGGAAQTGSMSIRLTDAPFPFDSVAKANMFVVRVDARFAEPTAAELDAPVNGDPSTGWVTIAAPNRSIDVLTLQSGREDNLGTKPDVPAGTYRGFRIVLDVAQSNLELRSGTKPAVNWNGTGARAYRITPAAAVTLAAGGVQNVLVDFDLGRSFDMVGTTPSAGFTATPSLRTIATAVQSGVVIGRVVLSDNTVIEGATVELLPSGTSGSDTDRSKILATTGSNAQGGFLLTHVTPGPYALRVTLPAARGRQQQTFDINATAPAASRASAARTFVIEAAPR